MYNRVVIKENRRMLIVNVILAVKFDVGIDNKKKKKTLVLDTSIGVGTTNI